MLTKQANQGVCAWCQQRFVKPSWGSGQPKDYCSYRHQLWAWQVSRGKFPLDDCPRCGCHDLTITGPDWAICQTCGYQTDRPDLAPGEITPRGSLSTLGGIKERLAARTS